MHRCNVRLVCCVAAVWGRAWLRCQDAHRELQDRLQAAFSRGVGAQRVAPSTQRARAASERTAQGPSSLAFMQLQRSRKQSGGWEHFSGAGREMDSARFGSWASDYEADARAVNPVFESVDSAAPPLPPPLPTAPNV